MWRALIFVIGAVMGGLILLAAGEWLRPAEAQSPTLPPPPNITLGPGSVFSYGQTGGITAGTVNIGPQPRDLNSAWGEPFKSQMLRNLPRDKDLTVTSILGDTETSDLAVQIWNFLKSNGFKMKEEGISQSVFVPTPHGLSFNAATSTFIVGSK
jgi:hypothetical protein